MAKGVENSPTGKRAKLELRRRALAWIEASKAHVFEGFAGNGAMWRAIWRDAASSVGVDRREIWDPGRVLYVAEVERVLRSIDLSPFNVFDLDAFGSPWPTAWVLSARRKLKPGERLALVTTDGGPMKARFGAAETAFATLAGVDRETLGTHVPASYARLSHQAAAGVAERMGGKVAWADVRAGLGNGGRMAYAAFGLVGAGAE